MIVARGLCDKCRKKEERREAGLNYPALGNKQTQASGTKWLAELLKLLEKAKVLRTDRERVLQVFMPYFGFSPETQQAMLRDMTAPDAEKIESSPLAKVHPGSIKAPTDGEVRKLITNKKTAQKLE